jgi:hypothetical protein
VESAFQIPVLESKIVIRLPEGMVFQGMKRAILNKTMQGLRQSSKLWGDLLHEFFMQYDRRIICSIKAGKCVYSIWTKDLKMMGARWVDDVFGFSSDNNGYFNGLLKALGRKYPLKLLGDMKRVLGMEIDYGPGWSLMRQQANIQHMMEEYHVEEFIGWDPKVPITQADLDKLIKHAEPQCKLPFRNLTGELLWACHTRPDIIHGVRRLSSYCNAYDEYAYWLELIMVKFMHSTREYGVKIEQSAEGRQGRALERPLEVYAFSDASHASVGDTMRSVSGAVTFLLGNPLIISCQIQKTVAMSSTESELVAATEAAKDVRLVM